MTDQAIRRWSGFAGVAAWVILIGALPLYFFTNGPAASLDATQAFSAFVARNRNLFLTRHALTDPLIMAGFCVFLAGFCQALRRARADCDWLASIVFGSGLIYIAITLVGDALEGGAALDTFVNPDPSVVRGLVEGGLLLYGANVLVVGALLMGAAGWGILASGAMPKWIGWFALLGAVGNLVGVPAMYGGTDATQFFTVAGYITFIGWGALGLWILIASLALVITKPKPANHGGG